jgi:hypothetical protein
MAVSRILSDPENIRDRDDHSSHSSRNRDERPDEFWFGHGATIPEALPGRLPFLCFVLHRMGFFMPRELLRER